MLEKWFNGELKIKKRSLRERLGSYLQGERIDAWVIDDFSERNPGPGKGLLVKQRKEKEEPGNIKETEAAANQGRADN